MSIIKRTFGCDWPGCNQQIELGAAVRSMREFRWASSNHSDHRIGRHLCPAHRRKTWEELSDAIVSEAMSIASAGGLG